MFTDVVLQAQRLVAVAPLANAPEADKDVQKLAELNTCMWIEGAGIADAGCSRMRVMRTRWVKHLCADNATWHIDVTCFLPISSHDIGQTSEDSLE